MGVKILLLAVFLNEMLWIATVPYNFAPDEVAHFDIVERFVEKGKYPVFLEDPPEGILRREGQTTASYSALQPLPYVLSSLPVFWVRNVVEKKYWYLFARLVSSVAITVFVGLVYKLFELVFGRREVALIGAGMAGFIPQVTFIGAYVTSDSTTLAISTAVLLAAVSIWFKKMLKTSDAIRLGLLFGIGVLTRFNAYPLLLVCGIWMLWTFYRKSGIKAVSIFGVCVLLISGWWFVRNIVLYGDPLVVDRFYGILREVRAYEFHNFGIWQMFTTTPWVPVTFKSAYASFDWNFLFLPDWFYWVVLGLVVTSILGLVIGWGRQNNRKLKVVLIVCLAAAGFTFYQTVIQSSKYSFQPQGRHMYPALAAFLILGMVGLVKVARLAWLKIILGFVVLSNLYSYLMIILPRYYVTGLNLQGFDWYKRALFEVVFNKPDPFSLLWIVVVVVVFGVSLAGYAYIVWKDNL